VLFVHRIPRAIVALGALMTVPSFRLEEFDLEALPDVPFTLNAAAVRHAYSDSIGQHTRALR
jgi:hypothetical protein